VAGDRGSGHATRNSQHLPVLDGLAVGYIIETGQQPETRRPSPGAIQSARTGLLRCEHFLHMRCEVSTGSARPSVPRIRWSARPLMDHTPGQHRLCEWTNIASTTRAMQAERRRWTR
jgi:alpha-D-ribose 1-methylphosphonate 5-triphosphate diphosphatase PhnM